MIYNNQSLIFSKIIIVKLIGLVKPSVEVDSIDKTFAVVSEIGQIFNGSNIIG